jgi:flavin reductase (DIM6/NTAB) family NADH-FMN oxidoreductase RutF
MKTIVPKDLSPSERHQLLVGSVAPRPIAFVSSLDAKGTPNLAPYSFFNVFSSTPPILVFSSNRRVKNNTTKDTLHNAEATGELVINMINYPIVRQAVLTSVEFPPEVSEFEKVGLTPIPSERVKPFRVKESPVQFECKVRDIIPLGDTGGAGHLIICDILLMHFAESIFDEKERINPHKIDLMGRMGRAFYVRASAESIHYIYQHITKPVVGYDGLPESVRNSEILTGNNLGQLSGIENAPSPSELEALKDQERIREILNSDSPLLELHKYAQLELAKDNVDLAARIAWLGETLSKTITSES